MHGLIFCARAGSAPPLVAMLLVTVLLSGCAGFHAPRDLSQQDMTWRERMALLSRIEGWQLNARMAVKSGKKGGGATLLWDYQSAQQKIELYGPFGGGRVIIYIDEYGAELKDSKGRSVSGDSAAEVLFAQLGWHVPFAELALWSRGLPTAGARRMRFDDAGRLLSFEQGDWRVSYQGYREAALAEGAGQIVLPRKITVNARPGAVKFYADNGEYIGDELQVKMVFKQWSDLQLRASP